MECSLRFTGSWQGDRNSWECSLRFTGSWLGIGTHGMQSEIESMGREIGTHGMQSEIH